MKKRTAAITIGVIWLLLLLVALTPTAPPVKAYDYDTGHASVIYSSDWNQSDADLMRAGWACSDIYDLFAARGINVYGHVENYEGAIYEWRVHNQTQDCETNHQTTAIFYHGHGGKINITNNIVDGPWRYFIYEQEAQGYQGIPTTIDDWQDVYPYTANNHRFVFLWACMQANEVGGYTSGYYRGMPYAWSHRTTLSIDGYDDPDAGNYIFIGFENISKSLSEWPTQDDTYEHWLVFFYNYATNGYSINEALDEASNLVWGEDFDETLLYQGYNATNPSYPAQGEPWYWSYMRVYGNGDRTLPC